MYSSFSIATSTKFLTTPCFSLSFLVVLQFRPDYFSTRQIDDELSYYKWINISVKTIVLVSSPVKLDRVINILHTESLGTILEKYKTNAILLVQYKILQTSARLDGSHKTRRLLFKSFSLFRFKSKPGNL